MKKIETLEQGLIIAATSKEETSIAAQDAAFKYEAEFDAVVKLNPVLGQLMEQRNTAQSAAKEAKVVYDETKKNAVKELLKIDDPEDILEIDAFGYRQFVEADYGDTIEFIKNVVKSGMLFMLKPDDKMITTFVKGMVQPGDTSTPYLLPEQIMNCLPGLRAKTVIKPTISDPKILKAAAK